MDFFDIKWNNIINLAYTELVLHTGEELKTKDTRPLYRVESIAFRSWRMNQKQHKTIIIKTTSTDDEEENVEETASEAREIKNAKNNHDKEEEDRNEKNTWFQVDCDWLLGTGGHTNVINVFSDAAWLFPLLLRPGLCLFSVLKVITFIEVVENILLFPIRLFVSVHHKRVFSISFPIYATTLLCARRNKKKTRNYVQTNQIK